MMMIMSSASTLATVKTYWTRFAQLTLTQLTNVNTTTTNNHPSITHNCHNSFIYTLSQNKCHYFDLTWLQHTHKFSQKRYRESWQSKIASFSHFTKSPSALTGKVQRHTISIFSFKCCIIALPDFNQSLTYPRLIQLHLTATTYVVFRVIATVYICFHVYSFTARDLVVQFYRVNVIFRPYGRKLSLKFRYFPSVRTEI